MRTAIFAFMFAALALFSTPIIAAELPALDSDFPEKWEKARENSCTPKPGVELRFEIYTQEANNGMVKVITLSSKNGVRYAQTKILTLGGRPMGIEMSVLKKGEVFSFSNHTPGDFEKMKATIFETLGLTEEEYASCGRR